MILLVGSVWYTSNNRQNESSDQQIVPANVQTTSTASPASTILSPTPQLPYRAYFAIFTNGTFRIFTLPMYHNLSPDVYITAETPNTITVTKTQQTWQDFFNTLPFTLSQDCLTTGTGEQFCTGPAGTLSFYLNGQNVPEALTRQLLPEDMLLVTYGSNETEIQQQLEELKEIQNTPVK